MPTEPDFETAFQRLNEIIAALERDDAPLEESLKRYEEGILLHRVCLKHLSAAEERMRILGADSADDALPAS